MTGYQDPATATARSAWRRSSRGPTSSPRAYGDRFRPTDRLRGDGGEGGVLPRLSPAGNRLCRNRRRHPRELGRILGRASPTAIPSSTSAACTCASARSRPCAGIDLQAVRRPGDRAAGPQRRRQVDHHAGARRGRPAHRGLGPWSAASTWHATRSRSSALVGYCPDVGGLVPAGHPVGAPPARGPAAPPRRLGGPRPRPARALRARRRRAPGHRRLLPRHGPSALGGASPRSTSPRCCCSTSPSTASTRSGSRRPSTSSRTPAPAAPACSSPPTCASSRSRPAATRPGAARRRPGRDHGRRRDGRGGRRRAYRALLD